MHLLQACRCFSLICTPPFFCWHSYILPFPQDRGPPARRLENQNPANPSRTFAARCCLVYATVHTWKFAKMAWRSWKNTISILCSSMVFWCVSSILYCYLISPHTLLCPGHFQEMRCKCDCFEVCFYVGKQLQTITCEKMQNLLVFTWFWSVVYRKYELWVKDHARCLLCTDLWRAVPCSRPVVLAKIMFDSNAVFVSNKYVGESQM